jgi:hypothetical protein
MTQTNGTTSLINVGNVVKTVHQIDASSPTGFLDQVSLWVFNPDGAAQTLRLNICGGPNFDFVIAPGALVQILDEIPFFGLAANPASSLITAINVVGNADLTVWGYFTR